MKIYKKKIYKKSIKRKRATVFPLLSFFTCMPQSPQHH